MTAEQMAYANAMFHQREPLLIHINNKPIQIGDELPDKIEYFNVWNDRFPKQVHQHEAAHIKQWLNKVIDKLVCEYVTYNNTHKLSSELKKFKG